MARRLTRIYTRTGDRGETGLADGERRPKDDPRVEALGAVDELNAHLGLLAGLLAAGEPAAPLVEELQQLLLDLGAELATPGRQDLGPADVRRLEEALDGLNAELPPLEEFLLPGGGPAAAQAHVARTVCRRAERRLVALARREPVNPHALAWLNRLSDLLFVLARSLARRHGAPERLWRGPRRRA